MSVVRHELEIVRDDLHANAVRIVGSDVGPMTVVAEIALGLGLECGSPVVLRVLAGGTRRDWSRGEAATRCTRPSGRVVFVAGSELTLFMQGSSRQERDRAPQEPQGRLGATRQWKAR